MGTAASALRGPRSFPHSAMREKSPTALSPTMSHMFLWLPVVTWDELGDTCIWRTGLWSVLLQELQLLRKAEEIHSDPSVPGPHDPTPGEASELPDILVSRSWAGDWMLQLQRLST
ncbi:uncharacterized protein LOC143439194 isoform X2 [Arvicanthis niloticus]|uniref:uncharacterized protein LOC143310764 n=1 Tax=Arvicanthis niloticus TaxID=61156 RepID=UPI00402B84C8